MVIRPDTHYIKLFKDLGLEIVCQREFGRAMKVKQDQLFWCLRRKLPVQKDSNPNCWGESQF